jgi:hypothetical protein
VTVPDAYRDALNAWAGNGREWYANWPLAEAHAIGELGRVSGNSYVFEGASRIPFGLDPGEVRLDAWTYQSAKELSVKIGLSAAAPGFEFLGEANAGIKAEFGSSSGVYVSASGTRIDRVVEVEPLRRELRARGADGTWPRGSAVVVGTLTAAKALILTATANNASFEAKVKTNVTVTPTVPADLAGNLSVVRGASAVDLQDYGTTRVVLAMRLLVLVSRGWLWWRHLDVRGVSALSDRQHLELLEATSHETDYLTRFDEP